MQGLNELLSIAKTQLPAGLALKAGEIINCHEDSYPEEQEFISTFSVGRKKEFTAGRVLARQAIVDLGEKPCAILSDNAGLPLWPKTLVGSISHKRNNCCVLVGLKEKFRSVGIDIELQEPLPQEMWSSFATNEEILEANVTNFSDEIFANMIFSAKEAFYKCIYPIARGTTPHATKIPIEVNKLDDVLFLGTRFDGCLWEGKMFLGSSYIMALSWLRGKNI